MATLNFPVAFVNRPVEVAAPVAPAFILNSELINIKVKGIRSVTDKMVFLITKL